jgi:hypothetical protein
LQKFNTHLLSFELTDTKSALHEHTMLDEYYPGPEVSYHHAKLLQELGELERLQALFPRFSRRPEPLAAITTTFIVYGSSWAKAAFQRG